MNVLLIAPNIRESLKSKISDGMPKFLGRNIGVYPPLGLCYIAAVLRDNGINVKIVDTNVEKFSINKVLKEIDKFQPDIIGISAMSFTFLNALYLAKKIKNKFDVPIVLGGNHASIYPKEVLSHDCIDVSVAGEGEYTMLELINSMKNSRGIEKVNGIVYKDKGRIISTKSRPLIKNLDELPIPSIDLLKLDRYYGCNMKTPWTTMITSRGCPFSCTFCCKEPFGNVYRYHSAERVVEEIKWYIEKFGIKSIEFFDDTFTMNRRRIKKIISLIKREKIEFEFAITTRIDTVDRELLKELKSTGCIKIHYGVESGDSRVLKILKKNTTQKQIEKVFNWSKEVGIESVAYVMVGIPTETINEIENTIKLLKKIEPDNIKCNVLIPYPGSQLYKNMVKYDKLEDYWKEITISGKDKETPLANKKLSRNELLKKRNQINRMSYFRLKTNLFKINKIKSIDDIKRTINFVVNSYFDKNI